MVADKMSNRLIRPNRLIGPIRLNRLIGPNRPNKKIGAPEKEAPKKILFVATL